MVVTFDALTWSCEETIYKLRKINKSNSFAHVESLDMHFEFV
jgi:hypothetical protein